MGRRGYRARLESGLKLDLNSLARRGTIRPGAATGPRGIIWTHSYWGDVASGVITADLSGTDEGWFRIQIDGGLDQRIIVVARPRHFGGRQWFFICPYLNQRCMVLWMPPGARHFASRQRWGRQVAYASQFCDRDNRAHRGKAKINADLCRVGGFDPDDWDFPPKPKWMRWSTYQRAERRFDAYDEMLEEGLAELLTKFQRRGWLK
jgi:hypothetical protein